MKQNKCETHTLSKLFYHICEKLKENIPLIECDQLLKNYKGTDWTKYVSFSNTSYRKFIVEQNDIAELVIISWNDNQEAKIHYHAENGCLMKILDGSIMEEKYYADDMKIMMINKLNTDNISYIEGKYILHKIISPNKAVSMHIYSPPNYVANYYE